MRLSDLYDADRRVTDARVSYAASGINVPGPLCGRKYPDRNFAPCRQRWCPWCRRWRKKYSLFRNA